MPRLSEDSKTRLDAAVLIAAGQLADNNTQLKSLHFGKPPSFSSYLLKLLLVYRSVNAELLAEDLSGHSKKDQVKLVAASIRRLLRAKRMVKTSLLVPVLRKQRTPNQDRTILNRSMTVYWPSTVLDALARC